ncbi:hypothetical protein [Streptomyces sp. 891-h]|uniref:hypothetical protein n=1 Tax=Streptomyces sp. 891-h TaxID=2720714 RepID=UPI001FA95BF3|nr:hypothetical protein [Streptomyces sp. 891-h]UNZ22292.1 hypothetical protein HC362_34655 [Streptomyces sp. 891-h]
MPKMHARKNDLAAIKANYGVKHADALAILDSEDREELCQLLAEYADITTYAEARDYLAELRADPRNQVMCDKCGWTWGMVCPECPGCGCYNGRCSGWRHLDYAGDDDFDGYDNECRDCGAGGDPYEECTCYWDDEEDQEHEAVPA